MDDRFAIINILSFNPHTMSNLTKNNYFLSKGLLCKSLKEKGRKNSLILSKKEHKKIIGFIEDGGKNLKMKTIWLQNKNWVNTTKLFYSSINFCSLRLKYSSCICQAWLIPPFFEFSRKKIMFISCPGELYQNGSYYFICSLLKKVPSYTTLFQT